jgi:excisionase family DNA binding protein
MNYNVECKEDAMLDEMMTTKQAAQRLQLHPQTLRRWLHAGKLRGQRLGSTRAGWRIPRSELERLMAEDVVEGQQ